MQSMSYEKHSPTDPNFPITFHPEEYDNSTFGFYMHWHEHVEILYFIGGSANIIIDNLQISVKQGDIAVVNSNCMHSMAVKPLDCQYHCLIIDKLFFDSFFEPLEGIIFNEIIRDEQVNSLLDLIADEMSQKKEYYKQTTKAYVFLLLAVMSRKFSASTSSIKDKIGSQKLTMVKDAISYVGMHYKENISIDDIVSHIGFSKYHFCHTFKEITGQTAFDYINILRCNQAKKLLCTGKHNISESALLSGFNNLSYFTKTYKKYMGGLPSQDV
ncbi:MAG: AraC family transcriptional regulator [Oscillospiraceae bacterium]